MKKFLTFLIIVLLIGTVFMSCSEPQPAKDPEGYTTMWYMDISNLDAMDDLNQMISGCATVSDKFAVYIITGGANWSGKEKDPKNNPFEMKADGTSYKYPELADQLKAAGFKDDGTNPFAKSFEPNKYQYWLFKAADSTGKSSFTEIWKEETKYMSDGDVLKGFINKVYSATKNNNTNYILFLWDHGGGSVNGLIWDYTVTPNPGMTNQALSDAIKVSDFCTAGKKFQAIVFDMCLMGTIEDANLVKDYAKCMIASENFSVASGYAAFFAYLSDHPTASYIDVATEFVDSAVEKHEGSDENEFTWSAIDLTDEKKLAAMNAAYNAFIKDVAATKDEGYSKLKTAAENSAEYLDDDKNRGDSYDILGVAERFYGTEDNATYKVLKTAINAVLIDEYCGKKVEKGKDDKEPGSTGLAFFFYPTLGQAIGEGKNYSEADFTNFCERVKGYFSEDVSKFYEDYRKVTAK